MIPLRSPLDAVGRISRAGLATAIVDGAFSSVLAQFVYGSGVIALWQRVAGTLIGPEALKGGMATVILGIAMHFFVAFGWSAVFVLIVARMEGIGRALTTTGGKVAIAAVYGPMIWMAMSFVVIPSLTHQPPVITYRWWVQFFGHFLFVGVPIVFFGHDSLNAETPRSLR
jgi:hypothetical protein